MSKHSYRINEKHIYIPKNKPETVNLEPMNYLSLPFLGNPNSENFTKAVEALYTFSYTIKMKAKTHANYFEHVVYPLEGEWDLIDKTVSPLDKNNFKALLMIRQPNFVNAEIVEEFRSIAFQKHKNEQILNIQYTTITEGLCVQMLHLGSYDNEPETFSQMTQYANDNHLNRISLTHKEIYLSDPRKTPQEKLKTVLRFQVDQ